MCASVFGLDSSLPRVKSFIKIDGLQLCSPLTYGPHITCIERSRPLLNVYQKFKKLFQFQISLPLKLCRTLCSLIICKTENVGFLCTQKDQSEEKFVFCACTIRNQSREKFIFCASTKNHQSNQS